MSRTHTPATDEVWQYISQVTLREPDVLRRLREETARLPNAQMQITPEQGQFMALLIRLTRAGAHEALLQDYVKFARAKGLTNRRIIGVHVLRNILIPIVTVVGLQFGALIAFAIVTESVFAWPGMGKLLIDSINVLDRPVIVAYLLIIVTMFIVINLVVDVLYSALDPRVRLTESKG